MGNYGKIIVMAGNLSVHYGEAMLKDVTPAMFGRKPVVNGKLIDCNHPAWVYGHLGLYSSRVCELLGIEPGPTVVPAGWNDLFKNGTPSTDDPAGTIFPAMDKLTKHYIDGYRYTLAKLPEVDDAAFMKPNPMGGRMSEMFPLIGGAVTFLLTGHAMSHLGQVSTWRRCMGLGSAM